MLYTTHIGGCTTYIVRLWASISLGTLKLLRNRAKQHQGSTLSKLAKHVHCTGLAMLGHHELSHKWLHPAHPEYTPLTKDFCSRIQGHLLCPCFALSGHSVAEPVAVPVLRIHKLLEGSYGFSSHGGWPSRPCGHICSWPSRACNKQTSALTALCT